MLVVKEMSLKEFEAWGGAIYTKNIIETFEKVEEFDFLVSELYPNGIGEVELNDFLAFEDYYIYECLEIEPMDLD